MSTFKNLYENHNLHCRIDGSVENLDIICHTEFPNFAYFGFNFVKEMLFNEIWLCYDRSKKVFCTCFRFGDCEVFSCIADVNDYGEEPDSDGFYCDNAWDIPFRRDFATFKEAFNYYNELVKTIAEKTSEFDNLDLSFEKVKDVLEYHGECVPHWFPNK